MTIAKALLVSLTAVPTIFSISPDTFLPAVEAVLCDHSSAKLLVILVDPCADHSDGSPLSGEAHVLDRADGTQLFDMIMEV